MHTEVVNAVTCLWVRWLPPLAAVLCCLVTKEHAWSRGHATSSLTAVLPPPGQHCGTVCLNSFGNRTSPSDNSNDRWKRLCLVSWAAAPCVWTLRALTRNLLTYLLTYLQTISFTVWLHDHLQWCSVFQRRHQGFEDDVQSDVKTVEYSENTLPLGWTVALHQHWYQTLGRLVDHVLFQSTLPVSSASELSKSSDRTSILRDLVTKLQYFTLKSNFTWKISLFLLLISLRKYFLIISHLLIEVIPILNWIILGSRLWTGQYEQQNERTV